MPAYAHSIENTLSFTSSVGVEWTRRFYVNNTLSFNHIVNVNEIVRTVTSQLDLVHDLTQNQLVESTSNTISLFQDVDYTSSLNLSVSNTLNLQQDLKTNLHYRAAENVLDLQQTAEPKAPIDHSLSNNISDCWWTDEEINTLTAEQLAALCDDRGLRHSVEVRRSITNLSVTDYLQLSQSAVKSLALQASNHIHLSHAANTVAAYEVIQSNLSLSQSLSYDKTILVTSTLDLTQVVDSDTTFNRSLTSTLNLSQLTALIDDSHLIPSPEFTAPNLVPTGQVILTYPFNGSISVTLRAPEFDNSEIFEFQRINRRTRGGDLVVHRQEYWPIAERLSMKFTNLTHAVTDSLLHFLKESLGKEIGLLDHENRYWKGIILTPSARVSVDTGRECQYSVSLEFEGVVVSDDQFEVNFLGTGLVTGTLT